MPELLSSQLDKDTALELAYYSKPLREVLAEADDSEKEEIEKEILLAEDIALIYLSKKPSADFSRDFRVPDNIVHFVNSVRSLRGPMTGEDSEIDKHNKATDELHQAHLDGSLDIRISLNQSVWGALPERDGIDFSERVGDATGPDSTVPYEDLEALWREGRAIIGGKIEKEVKLKQELFDFIMSGQAKGYISEDRVTHGLGIYAIDRTNFY